MLLKRHNIATIFNNFANFLLILGTINVTFVVQWHFVLHHIYMVIHYVDNFLILLPKFNLRIFTGISCQYWWKHPGDVIFS